MRESDEAGHIHTFFVFTRCTTRVHKECFCFSQQVTFFGFPWSNPDPSTNSFDPIISRMCALIALYVEFSKDLATLVGTNMCTSHKIVTTRRTKSTTHKASDQTRSCSLTFSGFFFNASIRLSSKCSASSVMTTRT